MDRRSENEIIFRTDDVTKVYDTGEVKVYALAGVDLELYASELTVLLGPSGSGKSTLLNILGGLDHATSGDVWFRDLQLSALNDRELTRYRRDNVGFVFQFYNLVPSLSARENVALVTDIAPDPMPPEEALSLVGLGHRLDHFPAEMSGGEQQRVAFCRALANAPELLLADEPTGNLDPETSDRVFGALMDLVRETGLSALIATHNHDLAARMDRIVHLDGGMVTPKT